MTRGSGRRGGGGGMETRVGRGLGRGFEREGRGVGARGMASRRAVRKRRGRPSRGILGGSGKGREGRNGTRGFCFCFCFCFVLDFGLFGGCERGEGKGGGEAGRGGEGGRVGGGKTFD